MSIALLVSVHDGIVLAADSASTLMLSRPGPGPAPVVLGPLNVYNNANKIANLCKGRPLGCVAFGAGSIGNASTSTLLKDFRSEFTGALINGIGPDHYTVQDVATALLRFLMQRVGELSSTPQTVLPLNLGVIVAGCSIQNGKRETLCEGWMIQIENGIGKPPQLLRSPDEAGITWGGVGDVLSRIVLGHGEALPAILSKFINPALMNNAMIEIRAGLQAPIVFPPMPIQDAIDLAEWLVQSAIMFSRFSPGVPTVGGPIEIAAITKHEGFKWVRRKHYFHSDLNREVENHEKY
jgi:hypothetical protein